MICLQLYLMEESKRSFYMDAYRAVAAYFRSPYKPSAFVHSFPLVCGLNVNDILL